jgi:hypothetical protein
VQNPAVSSNPFLTITTTFTITITITITITLQVQHPAVICTPFPYSL